MKAAEYKKVPVAELAKLGVGCAWRGCATSFKGDMPHGWRWLVAYHDAKPTIVNWTTDDWVHRRYQDIALCPEHAGHLFSMLKGGDVPDFDEALRMATKGSS